MTGDLLVHDNTAEALEMFAQNPSQALLLYGPNGIGKRTLAVRLAESILKIEPGAFSAYPYGLSLSPGDGKSIGIESVRRLEHFLSLKVPRPAGINRVIIIENAGTMTLESQNALLKNLEEPPKDTIILLTASHPGELLATIRSRAVSLPVHRPDPEVAGSYFQRQGFSEADVKQALAIGGELPGLAGAILNDDDHPLLIATARARRLLSVATFDRLLMVDELASRPDAISLAAILQQMARIGLFKADRKAAARWQTVLKAGYEAEQALLNNAAPKLVLTNLMLQL